MRLPFAILSSAAVLACAGAASADFMNYEVDRITLGNGHIIMNVYAKFTNSGDRVLNVFRTNITTTNATGFFQAGANPFWKAANTQNKSNSDDSWVCVGTNSSAGALNGNAGGLVNGVAGTGANVTGDPNFVNFTDANDSSDFSFIEGTGNGAGWYNGSPSNPYGYANESGAPNRVLLAHFVATDATVNDYVSWYARMTITRPGIEGSTEVNPGDSVNFMWIIPSPGAVALLGVAGLTSRRRRA